MSAPEEKIDKDHDLFMTCKYRAQNHVHIFNLRNISNMYILGEGKVRG